MIVDDDLKKIYQMRDEYISHIQKCRDTYARCYDQGAIDALNKVIKMD